MRPQPVDAGGRQELGRDGLGGFGVLRRAGRQPRHVHQALVALEGREEQLEGEGGRGGNHSGGIPPL
jgi:hypothetical protein